jgi:hypothetical protein
LLKESDDEREIENYMLKLENGLFALQSIVYIILDISVNGPQSVHSLKIILNNIYFRSLSITLKLIFILKTCLLLYKKV